MKQKISFTCWAIFSISVVLGSLFAGAAPQEGKFTIAVIPDSQQEVLKEGDNRLEHRLQWLVKHREALNLKMVLHVGDLMNWDTPDHIQYERASAAMSTLDKAGIPYAAALGNHDTSAVKVGGSAAPGNVNSNLRITTNYNAYFPISRWKALESVYEAGKVDNACHVFHACGLNWVVINLELWARTGAVQWAESVLQQHPHHNAIILTHSHLNAKGELEPTKGGYGDSSPEFVFSRLRKFANVRFIFSGHVGQHAYRVDQGVGSGVRSRGQGSGVSGQKAGQRTEDTGREQGAGSEEQGAELIHQFLQCYHDPVTNPVRLFEIDARQGAFKTWVYCPSAEAEKQDGSGMTITNVSWIAAAVTEGAPGPGRQQ